jgi:hypothetical protein
VQLAPQAARQAGADRARCSSLRRPLAKPVQIVGIVSVRAAANANRNAAPVASSHGAQSAA